jgi:hypothetical protein
MNDATTVAKQLAEPFAEADVKWKPKKLYPNKENPTRAMVIPYLDARAVIDRLDQVLGLDGWRDHYEVLQSGSVVCRLSIRLDDKWITKTDVGSPSAQGDAGDRMKAAFSDALKRAAVKLEIGRFLCHVRGQWIDYDRNKGGI